MQIAAILGCCCCLFVVWCEGYAENLQGHARRNRALEDQEQELEDKDNAAPVYYQVRVFQRHMYTIPDACARVLRVRSTCEKVPR